MIDTTNGKNDANGEKRGTLRIGSINLQKGIENKLMEIEKALEEKRIDILLTQEWGGWTTEESKYGRCINGYKNFMSFKTPVETKRDNVSELAMTKRERHEYRKKLNRKRRRKRGTTILVREGIINKMNINEVKIRKDGEIMAIELNIDKEKWIIINIHAEPEKKRGKKENFYKKIEKILDNNIGEAKVIIGGDANSVWDKKDTSNKNEEVDTSIRKWCEKREMIDIMKEKRKGIKGKKEWHT